MKTTDGELSQHHGAWTWLLIIGKWMVVLAIVAAVHYVASNPGFLNFYGFPLFVVGCVAGGLYLGLKRLSRFLDYFDDAGSENDEKEGHDPSSFEGI